MNYEFMYEYWEDVPAVDLSTPIHKHSSSNSNQYRSISIDKANTLDIQPLTLADLQTTNPSCGYPGLPANSDISSSGRTNFFKGESIIYTCQHGYVMLGPAVRECMEGGWSKTSPVCSEFNVCIKTKPKSVFFRGEHCLRTISHPVSYTWGLLPKPCS